MRQGEHSLVVSFSSWQQLSWILCLFIIQWVTSTRKKQGRRRMTLNNCYLLLCTCLKLKNEILNFIDGRIHLLTHFLMGLLKFNVLWNQQKCFKLIGAGVQQLYDINNMCYLTSGWCVLNICHLLILCVLELSFHS